MGRLKIIVLLVIVPVLLFVLSLTIGSTQNISVIELFQRMAIQLGFLQDPTLQDGSLNTILWQVRLPRVLLTFLVGAALASSGGVLQSIFRNPIVDPFTLGISSGSAFGAALAMLFPIMSVNLSAFIFGVCAVGLTYLVSYSGVRTSIVGMVLAGMVISGVFTALLTCYNI